MNIAVEATSENLLVRSGRHARWEGNGGADALSLANRPECASVLAVPPVTIACFRAVRAETRGGRQTSATRSLGLSA
jgi:hypothetical protein